MPPATVRVCDAGTDVRIDGVVVERTPAGIQPVADAVVNGRFPPAPFDPAIEKRTDTNGRYQLCRALPVGSCDSGICRLPFEISAGKDGYATASTTVTVDYDFWYPYGGPTKATDLELARE
jgi:hypothetical protein